MSEFTKLKYDFARDGNGKPTMDRYEQYSGYGYLVDIITSCEDGQKQVSINIDCTTDPSPYQPLLSLQYRDGRPIVRICPPSRDAMDLDRALTNGFLIRDAIEVYYQLANAIKAAKDLRDNILNPSSITPAQCSAR